MRSIIPARYCNAGDLASFGIHPIDTAFDPCDSMIGEPDLSDTVDVNELEAINRSLSAHAEEVDEVLPRRSYVLADYLPSPTKPAPPALALSRRLAA